MTRSAPQAKGKPKKRILRLPALEVRQGEHPLFCFAVDGKELDSFAAISRIRRDAKSEVVGYQRPQVLTHIAAIRRYLESENAILPTALVVAFDDCVRFEPDGGRSRGGAARKGTLVIPVLDGAADEDKPGWIVDGQQRGAALRDARIDGFPVFVTAFIAASEAEQRSQFILVNSTKPLPKGLIHELLPTTTGTLPVALQVRRFPAKILDRLNHDEGSPFRHRIQTPTRPEGTIKDNSVLRMLENSLTNGALYQYRDGETGEGDIESMLLLVSNYWNAVSETFGSAWKLPPRQSRLVHGVGIVSMGYLMDAAAVRWTKPGPPTKAFFEGEIQRIANLCHWTEGTWSFGGEVTRRWNDLQNTTKDIQLLVRYLSDQYAAAVTATKVHRRRVAPRPTRPVTGD